jgi:hypothetical protein
MDDIAWISSKFVQDASHIYGKIVEYLGYAAGAEALIRAIVATGMVAFLKTAYLKVREAGLRAALAQMRAGTLGTALSEAVVVPEGAAIAEGAAVEESVTVAPPAARIARSGLSSDLPGARVPEGASVEGGGLRTRIGGETPPVPEGRTVPGQRGPTPEIGSRGPGAKPPTVEAPPDTVTTAPSRTEGTTTPPDAPPAPEPTTPRPTREPVRPQGSRTGEVSESESPKEPASGGQGRPDDTPRKGSRPQKRPDHSGEQRGGSEGESDGKRSLGVVESPETPANWDHLFEGEVNSKGKAVGYHSRPGGVDPAGARVVEVTKPPDAHGVYEARVAVKDPASGVEIPKGARSTFFPDSWSAERVKAEVSSAYRNRVEIEPGHWKGTSTSGVPIEGYDGPQGIKTAFPKYTK